MVSILRIGGKHLKSTDVLDVTKIVPYRVVSAGVAGSKDTCLYYDVITNNYKHNRSYFCGIEEFILMHEDDLIKISSIKDVDYKDVDIAIMFYENYMSLNIAVDMKIALMLSRVGLSLSLSVYKASG